jgi:hypothetical protein
VSDQLFRANGAPRHQPDLARQPLIAGFSFQCRSIPEAPPAAALARIYNDRFNSLVLRNQQHANQSDLQQISRVWMGPVRDAS